MRKYLREIEVAGLLLIAIGIVISCFWGYLFGAWPCGVGLLLLLAIVIYKAFNWAEYERENKQYIVIILICIFILILQLLNAR